MHVFLFCFPSGDLEAQDCGVEKGQEEKDCLDRSKHVDEMGRYWGEKEKKGLFIHPQGNEGNIEIRPIEVISTAHNIVGVDMPGYDNLMENYAPASRYLL